MFLIDKVNEKDISVSFWKECKNSIPMFSYWVHIKSKGFVRELQMIIQFRKSSLRMFNSLKFLDMICLLFSYE